MTRLDAFVLAVASDAEYRFAKDAAESAMRRGDFDKARELTARMDAIADAIAKRLKRTETN